ncbi:MAG: hypothetical protein Q9163_001585 [Psora crenata]
MGTRGLRIVRHRGRFYVKYYQFDSYPEGWPKDLVKQIPKDPKGFDKWLAEQRAQYDAYHEALESYLSVVRIETEKVSEEIHRQISCSSSPPPVEEWFEGTGCEDTYGLPHYTTKLNDLYLEWTYTIDLDHEVFSVDSRVHFKLNYVSRIDWIDTLTRDNNGDSIFDLANTPKCVMGTNARLLRPLHPEMMAAYDALQVTKVKPKGLAGFAPAQRHGPLLCGTLLQRFLQQEQPLLELLLGSWSTEDFAFREYAYIILCFASLSLNISIENSDDFHSQNRQGYVDLSDKSKRGQTSEFLTLPATGSHLDGQPAGAWPDSDTFWFEGALIRLVPYIDEGYEAHLIQQVALLQQHCALHYPRKSINAVIFDVATVALVKIHKDGSIDHTDWLPVFELGFDYTINAGTNRPDYPTAEDDDNPLEKALDEVQDEGQVEDEGKPQDEGQVEDEDQAQVEDEVQDEGPKEVGSERKLMNLFLQMVFGPESEQDKVVAGFKELQEEEGSKRSKKTSQQDDAETMEAENQNSAQTASSVDKEVNKEDVDKEDADKEGVDKVHHGDSEQSIGEATRVDTDLQPDNGNDQNETQQAAASDETPVPDANNVDYLGMAAGRSTTLIPTEEGFVMKTYDDDGTEKTEEYRETVRGGAHVTERITDRGGANESGSTRNAGFFALAQFFDATARAELISFQHNKTIFPPEIHRLIISKVDDMSTYRSCMQVSHDFREICMENFRLDNESIFIANKQTSEDATRAANLAADASLVYNSICISTGEREELRAGKLRTSLFGAVREELLVFKAVVGNERDKRIFIPAAAAVFQ